MKTYLVTGGAGFIGSNFVQYIIDKHGIDRLRIIVLDLLTYAGNLKNREKELELPCVDFVKGDIGDAQLVGEIFDKYDIDYVKPDIKQPHYAHYPNPAHSKWQKRQQA